MMATTLDLNNVQIGPDPDYDPFTTATNPNPPKPRFNVLSAGDALQPQPPIQEVVEHLLAEASLNIFFGEPGCKKTWALLDMAVCVAMAKDWLGLKTTQSPVLIIDEDNGERRILRRMGSILRGHNADANTPVYCISFAGFDFGKDEDAEYLKHFINVLDFRLVIIDVLASVMPGRDENSVKDTQPVLLRLRRVAQETGAAIVLIHHSNKTGGYRGSTSIKGALETMILVESKQGEDSITFKAEKTRDDATVNFGANIHFENTGPKKVWLSANAKPVKPISTSTYNKAERFVLLYLFNHGESKSSDITGSIDPMAGDPAPKSVSNAISSLKTNLLIERTDNGTAGTVGTYQLTKRGEDETQIL